ncbi:unnamed protein product [Lymnaea stagnalis]|uniref:Uncharacterized protein n=1 Tax=Lymnaea stagnalis TaxID=6523 RepID=A0AAV2IN95_LYMST
MCSARVVTSVGLMTRMSQWLNFGLLVAYLASVGTCRAHSFCHYACDVPQQQTEEVSQLFQVMCGCLNENMPPKYDLLLDMGPDDKYLSVQPFAATTQKPPPSTTDICDLLCSIQIGGDACLCGNPSLPGK